MIKISKNEAFAMRKAGYDEFVKSTYGKRHKTYYLVEDEDSWYWDRKLKRRVVTRQGALSAYYEYKNSKVASTYAPCVS